MKRRLLGALLVTICTAAAAPLQGRPERIVSLIPAVTEMLFAIGAGPQVVAVGTFDTYPPEVGKLARVGALLDPDTEKILSLRPDLVIVYGSQTDLKQQLERAGIPIFLYSHAGLADVTKTMRALGDRTGRALEAERAARAVEDGLADIRKRVAGRPRPRTLLVFGREAGALRGIYASAGVGFLHDMMVVAGGDDVLADVGRQSLQATTELILARRPDVIIELRSGRMSDAELDDQRTDWNALSAVPAVKNGRVYLIADARTMVPGPRVVEGTRLLAQAIHPDAFK